MPKEIVINKTLSNNLDNLNKIPYGDNLVCMLDVENIDNDIKNSKIDKSAVSYFQDEIEIYENKM